jgi:protein-S-isoprenylcysteine O-methyltransferase Ste14
MLLSRVAVIVLLYHAASRLAYVLYVGVRLSGQERDSVFAGSRRAIAAFHRFRHMAAFLMANDAISFVALCVATRHTLPLHLGTPTLLGIGALLALIGIGVKAWARREVGRSAYYWEDFFNPEVAHIVPRGPYRVLRNPMYTVGYLQAYGLAIGLASLPGLLAAAFDQVAILVFHAIVERPHVAELERR